MRVLLDENLDWRLVRYFDAECHVTTVDRQGWKAKQNGELLAQAEADFDVFVTMDKGFEHQQNISKYAIGVIIISARTNKLQDILPANAQRRATRTSHLRFRRRRTLTYSPTLRPGEYVSLFSDP